MSSVLSTSTMKSPPLEVCVTGSFEGASVSAATSLGPGAAALRSGRGAATCALAAEGASAAAPTKLAPLRKLRRATSGEFRRFGMGALRAVASYSGMGSAQIWFVRQAEENAGREPGVSRHARGRYRGPGPGTTVRKP